jgi:hypothetical protein
VLATAHAALDEAMAGAGQLLLISGEPGIGKSALLTELADTAATRDARVLRGNCWDGGGAPAYWPWTQVLREAERYGVDLGPAARLLGTSTPRPPDAALSADAPDPVGARFQLLDAVGAVLVRLAGMAPLLVTLDDLQWADEPSLQLLDFAARRVSGEPVLLVGAYRDAEAGSVLRAVAGGRQQLPLVGLTSDDVEALMIMVATAHDLPPPPGPLVAEVWRRSGGNPFFARELTRLIVAQGWWTSEPGQGRTLPHASPAVPDSVRDTLERRLARLSQPCADLLAVAAVAGLEVREELLGRVVHSDADGPSLPELLAEAAGARVLVPPLEVSGRYRFVHDLYRETIQAGLTPAERCTLHLAVGRALESLRAEGGDVHLAEVATHLLASGADEALADAVRLSAAAAAEAMSRLGYEDARRHFERALAAWDRAGGDPAQRLELLLGLADARSCAGDGEGARADLRRAVELARRMGDAAGLARAAIALHHLGARVSLHVAANVELLTEAAAALPETPTALRVRVLTALVRSMRHQRVAGDEAGIVAAAREAVRVARVVGEPSPLAFALLALHDALWQPGSGPQRLEVLDEMRAAAATAGEFDLLAQTHQLRAAALLEAGDPSGRTELARYVELMAGRGHAQGRWEAMSRGATLASIGGRWAEADAMATEACDFGRAIGVPDAVGVYGTLNASLLVFGEIEGGFDPDDLDESAPAGSYVQPLRAVWHLSRGDGAAAKEALAGYPVDTMEASLDLEPLALLAGAIAPAGSDEQRKRVYDRILPYAGLHAVVGGCASYWGAVDHHLAQLAAGLGWRQEAMVHLEAAMAAYERLGAPAWAARCSQLLEELHAAAGLPQQDGAADVGNRVVFRFDRGSWELGYQGKHVHLPDAKGLRDIALLLSSPGRPVHVLRLLGVDEPGGADPVLDERARKAYKARLDDLDAEIEEAQRWQDPVRAERAALERDALIAELTAAAGLAGRRRLLGDRTERARKTVSARIRDALRRIDIAHPELAEHLRSTITTGSECMYVPERLGHSQNDLNRPR